MKIRLIFVGLALAVLLFIPGALAAYDDLTGTVLSVSSEGVASINIASSNALGITGVTTILLSDQATAAAMQSYVGKELTFEILGHDILGRLVCEAYQNGVPIDYVPVKLPPKKLPEPRPRFDDSHPAPDDSKPAPNGGTPPADGTRPGNGAGTPPADGTEPPASDGTAPPADGNKPPADGSTPPADGAQPGSGSGSGSGTQPGEGTQSPANGGGPQTDNAGQVTT